ncbi:MAG: tRNA-dihydrouridine synthase family protein [Lentisphaeria bacterium]|nr:tRNA-dihydrouridine synthase family protein [Lentisphaeria bacterium]
MVCDQAAMLPSAWLEPLPFGDGFLPSRVLPGPLDGLTQGVMVACYSRLGLVPCWITPFIRVSNAAPGGNRLRKRLLPYFETGLPVVAQVMGIHADVLAETAAGCCELGAVGVDLNCGCPSNTVISSGAGGAKLRDPGWIHDCLRGLRRACPGKGISVKIRSGFADPAELDDIVPAVAAADVDFFTLHFRTVKESYAEVKHGRGRLSRAKQLAGPVPMIASGDLFSIRDAVNAWERSGCDGVAPARGLLNNPYLLKDIAQVCAGGAPPERSPADVLTVLEMEARLAAETGITRTGFLLEAARQAFGPDSEAFRSLVRADNPMAFAVTAKRLRGEWASPRTCQPPPTALDSAKRID